MEIQEVGWVGDVLKIGIGKGRHYNLFMRRGLLHASRSDFGFASLSSTLRDVLFCDVEASLESDAAGISNRKSPWNEGVNTSSSGWSFQCQRVYIRVMNGGIIRFLHNGW